MVFAVALVSCSVASAQAPDPIPDAGPGSGISICDECCGIEEEIYTKQQLYAVMETELDELDADLANAQAQLAYAIQSGASPADIAYFQNSVSTYEQLIAAKQTVMAVVALQINLLWDLWFETGCHEADC